MRSQNDRHARVPMRSFLSDLIEFLNQRRYLDYGYSDVLQRGHTATSSDGFESTVCPIWFLCYLILAIEPWSLVRFANDDIPKAVFERMVDANQN